MPCALGLIGLSPTGLNSRRRAPGNKDWEAAYREARERWKRGEHAVFPNGTYWLRRFANVEVEPPPLA